MKHFMLLVSILLIFAFFAAGCTPAPVPAETPSPTPTSTPSPTPTPEPTEEPEPTEAAGYDSLTFADLAETRGTWDSNHIFYSHPLLDIGFQLPAGWEYDDETTAEWRDSLEDDTHLIEFVIAEHSTLSLVIMDIREGTKQDAVSSLDRLYFNYPRLTFNIDTTAKLIDRSFYIASGIGPSDTDDNDMAIIQMHTFINNNLLLTIQARAQNVTEKGKDALLAAIQQAFVAVTDDYVPTQSTNPSFGQLTQARGLWDTTDAYYVHPELGMSFFRPDGWDHITESESQWRDSYENSDALVEFLLWRADERAWLTLNVCRGSAQNMEQELDRAVDSLGGMDFEDISLSLSDRDFSGIMGYGQDNNGNPLSLVMLATSVSNDAYLIIEAQAADDSQTTLDALQETIEKSFSTFALVDSPPAGNAGWDGSLYYNEAADFSFRVPDGWMDVGDLDGMDIFDVAIAPEFDSDIAAFCIQVISADKVAQSWDDAEDYMNELLKASYLDYNTRMSDVIMPVAGKEYCTAYGELNDLPEIGVYLMAADANGAIVRIDCIMKESGNDAFVDLLADCIGTYDNPPK